MLNLQTLSKKSLQTLLLTASLREGPEDEAAIAVCTQSLKEEHLTQKNVNFKLKISDRGRLSQEIKQNKVKKTNKMSSLQLVFAVSRMLFFSVGSFREILLI